jgi:hypothetical protein
MVRRKDRDVAGSAGRVLAAMEFFRKGNQGFDNRILKSVNNPAK